MKREFDVKNVHFEVANYTPRKNEFERGLKYKLFVNGYGTGYVFERISEPKVYAYVMDSNDKFLYNACYLADTPEAYALVAKYAGAFMEAFNDYMTYINVK